MGATPAGDSTGLSDDVFLKMGATPVGSAMDPSDQAFIDMGATPVPRAPSRRITRVYDGLDAVVTLPPEQMEARFPIPELSAAREPTMMESLRANNPFLNDILPTTKAQQWKKRQNDISFQRQLPQITSQMKVDPEGMRTDQEETDRVDKIVFEAAKKSGVSEAVIRNALRGGVAGDMALQIGLPLGGAVGGGALGTGLVVAGFVPGPVVGTIAGGAAGAALADVLVQTRRIIRGDQQEFDVGMIGVSTLLGGINLGPLKGASAVETVLAKQPLIRPSQITYASERMLPKGVNTFLTRMEGINRAKVSRVGEGMASYGGQGVVQGSGGEAIRQLINEGEITEPAKLMEYIPMAAGMGAAFAAAPALYRAIRDKTPEQALAILKTVPETPETLLVQARINEMLGITDVPVPRDPPITVNSLRQEALNDQRQAQSAFSGPGAAEQSATVIQNLLAQQEGRAAAGAGGGNLERSLAARQGAGPEITPNPEQVQAEAFARGQLPAPEAPGPELSAQAQSMEDKFGFNPGRISLSVAEPALGALTGKVAARITGQDEETEDEWTKKGFMLGMGANNLLLRITRNPGVVNTKLGAAAFHGTPHKVGKFSNEKIGTGEGAQVYGYGLYFAEKRQVADGYASKLTPKTYRVNGVVVDMPRNWSDRTPRQIAIQDIDDWGYETALKYHSPDENLNNSGLFKAEKALRFEAVKALKGSKIETSQAGGNLYKVDLNLEPTEILNLDRPLSEQSHILSKLTSSPEVEAKWKSVSDDLFDGISSAEDISGRRLYDQLEKGMGGPKEASEFLNSVGIKGSQYADADSRYLSKAQDFEIMSGAELKKRDGVLVYRLGKTNPSVTTKAMEQGYYVVEKGGFTPVGDNIYSSRELAEAAIPGLIKKPTSNYVVFDENRINILEENDAPFQKLVNWADGVLKDRGVGSGAVNSMDPELMAAMTIKLGEQAKKGAIKFDEWANGMIAQHGEGVTPHLQDIWESSLRAGMMKPPRESSQKKVKVESPFARSLEEIEKNIPPERRYIGTSVKRPDGGDWKDSSLNEKIGDLGYTKAKIDQAWQTAIKKSGPAAARALADLRSKGVEMLPPNEAHWASVGNLPKKDRFWYETSSESQKDSFPDRTNKELEQVPDTMAVTSPLANPNYNAELAVAALSEIERGVPISNPAINQSGLSEVARGIELTGDNRKVGSFSKTFKWLMGLTDSPPLTTNDRQVANSFGVPTETFGKYPVLYETVAEFYNQLRDDFNTRNAGKFGNDGPMQAHQLQAPSWVQTRAERQAQNAVLDPEDMIFEGDAYGSALNKAADKLRAGGVEVPTDAKGNPLFTKEVLRNPKVVDILTPSSKGFRDSTKATQEVGTDLTPTGKAFNQAVATSKLLGLKLNLVKAGEVIDRHLKRLSQRTKIEGQSTKTPSLATQLADVFTKKKADISRMELGWGTFEGVMSRNLRIPIEDVPSQYRNAYLAILGGPLKQKAQAASQFLDAPKEGSTPTQSAFVPGLIEPTPAIQNLVEELSKIGHDVNIHARPNGLVIDINPKFGDAGPVGIDPVQFKNIVGTVLGPKATVYPTYHSSYYVERPNYRKEITKAKNELSRELAGPISKTFGTDRGALNRAAAFVRGEDSGPEVGSAILKRRMEAARGEYASRILGLESAQSEIARAALNMEADMATTLPKLEGRIARERKRMGNMGSTYGGADPELLRLIAQHGGGAAVGFAYGLASGSDLPTEERLLKALTWAGISGGLGPIVARKLMSELSTSSKPVSKSIIPAGGGKTLADVRRVFEPAPVGKKAVVEGVKAIPGKVVTAVQNTFNSLSQLETAVVGRQKLTLGDKFSLVAGAAGKAERGILLLDQVQKDLIPDVSREDLNSFLFLRRTFDRLQAEARNPDAGSRAVGDYTIADVRKLMSELGQEIGIAKMARLEEFGAEVQKSADADLQLMVQSGRLSPEKYAEIKKMNDFYAPFYVMDYMAALEGATPGVGRKIDTTVPLTKGITGITNENFRLGDMMTALKMNKLKAHVLAEKNRAMLQLVDVANADTKGEFIKILKPYEKPPAGWQTVKFMRDGKINELAVTNDVADAVKGLDPIQMGLINQGLRAAAGPLRMGTTALYAAFQVVNQFKDQARVALVSKYGLRSPVDLIQYPLDFMHALSSSWFKAAGYRTDLAKDFADSGAMGSTMAANLAPSSFSLLAREPGGAAKVARILGIPVTSILDTTAKVGNAFEESAKMLTYKRGARVERLASLTGKARQDALDRVAYEVRNYGGSPDFSKHGTIGVEMNLLFMFANARMQGISADMRRLVGDPLRWVNKKEAAQAWIKLTTGVGFVTTYTWFQNQQPENIEDFENRTGAEKQNYFLVPKYDESGKPLYFTNDQGEKVRDYHRFPKAEIIGSFANTIEAGLEFGKKKDPKAFAAVGVSILEGMSPISITGKNLNERMESMMSGLNPIIKAPIEMVMNRDTFRHTDIVPRRMQSASPMEQYRTTTPQPFIDAAQAMPSMAPDRLKSPLHLQHLTTNITGNLLTQFMRPEQEGRSPLTSHPVLGRFFGSPYNDTEDDWKQIDELRTKDTDLGLNRERAMTDFLNKSPEMDPNTRFNTLANILRADPVNNLRALTRTLGDNVAGTTPIDRAVRNLSSRGTAIYLERKMGEIKDPESKRQFYLDMYNRKVLTPQVGDEIAKLRAEQNKP